MCSIDPIQCNKALQEEQQQQQQQQPQEEQQQQQQHLINTARSSTGNKCSCLRLGLWDMLCKNPRRIVHALKVGLALCLTSTFMLVEEPPSLLGENAIWAIMTVVVVFEFTVGATLNKGLNRGLGTIAAALAGLGVSHLADFFSDMGEAAVIIASVFVAGALATFVRFIPRVKAKYDYGVLIFLLTFSLISVSSYKNSNSIKTASTRIFTILMGCGISLVTCMFLMPVWAGEDLHKMTANNLDTLADCLRGSVEEYLEKPVTTMQTVMEKEDQNKADNDSIYVKYRILLSSIQTEESMANFAEWEPPHGRFMKFRYPWRQYVKIGAAIRHCAYSSMSLHGCLRSEVQAPYELRQVFRNELLKVSSDLVQVLRELATSIREMRRCQPPDVMVMELTASTEELQASIDARSHLFVTPQMKWPLAGNEADVTMHNRNNSPCLLQATLRRLSTLGSLSMHSIASASNFSLATFASLLIETVARLDNVVDCTDYLGALAKFKPPPPSPAAPSNSSLVVDVLEPSPPPQARRSLFESDEIHRMPNTNCE